jgi:hypothetical protein
MMVAKKAEYLVVMLGMSKVVSMAELWAASLVLCLADEMV